MPGLDNSVFTRLKAGDGVEGMIAYAIYKQAKREWIAGSNPSPDEIEAYHRHITETSLVLFRNEARTILAKYAEAAISAAAPTFKQEGANSAIVAEVKNQQSFIKNLGMSVLGAIVFSVFLFLFGLAYFSPTIQDLIRRAEAPATTNSPTK